MRFWRSVSLGDVLILGVIGSVICDPACTNSDITTLGSNDPLGTLASLCNSQTSLSSCSGALGANLTPGCTACLTNFVGSRVLNGKTGELCFEEHMADSQSCSLSGWNAVFLQDCAKPICGTSDVTVLGAVSPVAKLVTSCSGDHQTLATCAADSGVSSDCQLCISNEVSLLSIGEVPADTCFAQQLAPNPTCNIGDLDSLLIQHCYRIEHPLPPDPSVCAAASMSSDWYNGLMYCGLAKANVSLATCLGSAPGGDYTVLGEVIANQTTCATSCVAGFHSAVKTLSIYDPAWKAACLGTTNGTWDSGSSFTTIRSAGCLRGLKDAIETFNTCAVNMYDIVTGATNKRCSLNDATTLNVASTPLSAVLQSVGGLAAVRFPLQTSCSTCANEFADTVYATMTALPDNCGSPYYGVANCTFGIESALAAYVSCSGGHEIYTSTVMNSCTVDSVHNDLVERPFNSFYRCSQKGNGESPINCDETGGWFKMAFAYRSWPGLGVDCNGCWWRLRQAVLEGCTRGMSRQQCVKQMTDNNAIARFALCSGYQLVTDVTNCAAELDRNVSALVDYSAMLARVLIAVNGNSEVTGLTKPTGFACETCYTSLAANMKLLLTAASEDVRNTCGTTPYASGCTDTLEPALAYFEDCSGVSMRTCSASQVAELRSKNFRAMLLNAVVGGSSIAFQIEIMGFQVVTSTTLPCLSCMQNLITALSTNVSALTSTCDLSRPYGGYSCWFSSALRNFELCAGFGVNSPFAPTFTINSTVVKPSIPRNASLDNAICGSSCGTDFTSVVNDPHMILNFTKTLLGSRDNLPPSLQAALAASDTSALDSETQKNITLIAGTAAIYGGSVGAYLSSIVAGLNSDGSPLSVQQENLGTFLGAISFADSSSPTTIAVVAAVASGDTAGGSPAVKALASIVDHVPDGIPPVAASNLLSIAVGSFSPMSPLLNNLNFIIGRANLDTADPTSANSAPALVDLAAGSSNSTCISLIAGAMNRVVASTQGVAAVIDALSAGRSANTSTMADLLKIATEQALSAVDAAALAQKIMSNSQRPQASIALSVVFLPMGSLVGSIL